MAVDVIVTGACGRMGKEICSIVLADGSLTLTGALEAPGNAAIGRDIGSLFGSSASGVLVGDSVGALKLNAAVIIDFSAPAALEALLEKAESSTARLVVGTTGLEKGQIAKLERFALNHAVVFSPNMSLGVNLLFHLTDIVARRLGTAFDIEIVEVHHHNKKDAPSGTARRLGEIAAGALGRSYDDAVVDGRAGMVGARPKNEIGMHAVRGGDIVGDHTVLFAGNGERIELKHMAHSRAPLAAGAVAAARWIVSKDPGLYSMKDVLGL